MKTLMLLDVAVFVAVLVARYRAQNLDLYDAVLVSLGWLFSASLVLTTLVFG